MCILLYDEDVLYIKKGIIVKMKNGILISLVLGIILCGGIIKSNVKENQKVNQNISDVKVTNAQKRIEAGKYYLEYGKYENITYSVEDGGGTYILNEDGTFTCTNFQGTATGTYTVSLETYTNSKDTLTNWIISFKSSDDNMYANTDWIIDGNNQFSGIQDGGTNKKI